MKKLFLILSQVIVLILNIPGSYADDNKLPDPYLKLLPKGTDVSILIQTVEEQPTTLMTFRNNQFKQPASVQKLITALAAELELGSDFRFITQLQTTGKIDNRQLNGDLVIKMSGDPTLTRQQLTEMLLTLKNSGIDNINGNIIIDGSIFMGHDKASGWSWNNLTSCYNTAPSAVVINNNCFIATLLPAKKVGDDAKISVSPQYPVVMSGDVKTISSRSKNLADKYCELNVESTNQNNYYLSGCLKQNSPKMSLKFAITDNIDYFSTILKAELTQNRIKFTGKIVENKRPIHQSMTTLATNRSAPLSELLTIMLKKSNNLIADTVFRTIGAHYFNMPGSWQNSSDAVRAILLEKAHIDLGNAVIMDGSGLSRLNLIDTNKLMQVLQYIAANNDKLQMIEMLPIAGVDGTLQYRKGFIKSDLKSRFYAKTGYLEGNYNLAGFIKQQEGRYIAFVQLISGYNHIELENEPKDSELVKFEQALYLDILKREELTSSKIDN